MPTFDVVVPCYNYARFLERCVQSALSQEGADVRVLIIDDCSSDDSALVGQKLALDDPRVEFRRHERNQGHIATYNEGLIGWAKADYCLLLSADDALAPGAFQRALKLFEASEDVGLVFGTAKIIMQDEDFSFPSENDFTSGQIVSGATFVKHCCETTVNPVPTATAIARTSWQHSVGGYRREFPHTGDLEMWMRFAARGSIGLVRSVQGEYRQHNSNMSQDYYKRVLGDRREFALTCRAGVEPILASQPEARMWLDTMHAVLVSYAEQNAADAFERGDIATFDAWASLRDEMSGYLRTPRRSQRLMIRKLVGYRVWKLLRTVQRALGRTTPQLGGPISQTAFKHGDLIGWWPEPSSAAR